MLTWVVTTRRWFYAFDYCSHLADGTDGHLQGLRRVNDMSGDVVQKREVRLLGEAGISTLRVGAHVNIVLRPSSGREITFSKSRMVLRNVHTE
jgi:hypothetical protein